MNSATTMTVSPRSTAVATRTAAAPSRALASVRATTAMVPMADPETDLTLRSMSNRLESLGGNRYAILGAFPHADRVRLELRADVLAGLLTPGEPAAILRSVGMLRTMKGEVAVDADVRKSLMAAHIALLGHYPAWAVEFVCHRFMRSRDRFAPDAGILADACETLLIPVRAELRRIEHILSAEVEDLPSEAERAKVAEACQAFIAEMAKAADPRQGLRETPGQAAAVAREAAHAAVAAMPKHDEAAAGSIEGVDDAG